MTKKDYELIAEVLRETHPGSETPQDTGYAILYAARLKHWEDTRDIFARCLSGENPRFDRAKFLTACEPRP